MTEEAQRLHDRYKSCKDNWNLVFDTLHNIERIMENEIQIPSELEDIYKARISISLLENRLKLVRDSAKKELEEYQKTCNHHFVHVCWTHSGEIKTCRFCGLDEY